MVRLGLPAVARVREHDASVAKRKERAFAVARIAGARRKVERPPNAWRGARQDLQHNLADRARRAVGKSGRMAAIRREERDELARLHRKSFSHGAPEGDVASRFERCGGLGRRRHGAIRLRAGERHLHVYVGVVGLEQIRIAPRLELCVKHVRPAVRAVYLVAARRERIQIGTLQEFKRLFKMPVQREETRRVRDRRDDDRRRRAGRDARRRKDCAKGKSPIWKSATHDPSSR